MQPPSAAPAASATLGTSVSGTSLASSVRSEGTSHLRHTTSLTSHGALTAYCIYYHIKPELFLELKLTFPVN